MKSIDISDNLQNISENIEHIESLSLDSVLAEDVTEVEPYGGISLINGVMSDGRDDNQELKMKKAQMAALLFAKERGVLPDKIDSSITRLSAVAIADETVSLANIAMKISVGELDVYEAADAMIDKATARVLAVSDEVVAAGVEVAYKAATDAVVKEFPPAGIVMKCAKPFIPMLTKKAQSAVRAGIKSLGEYAKSVSTTIIDTVKGTVKNIIKFLQS
jgi:hypothetical protein